MLLLLLLLQTMRMMGVSSYVSKLVSSVSALDRKNLKPRQI